MAAIVSGSAVTVSRSALRHNLQTFQRLVGSTTIVIPVVKGNAYGHGLAEVVQATKALTDVYAIVNTAEALALTHLAPTKRIFVLAFVTPDECQRLARSSVVFPLYTDEQLKLYRTVAKKTRRTIHCQLKIDVGTTRIGLQPAAAAAFVKHHQRTPGIQIDAVYAHFATSEDANQTFTNTQLRLYEQTVRQLKRLCPTITIDHIACSAATLRQSRTHRSFVRIGIGLYGQWPSSDVQRWIHTNRPSISLRPALQWATTVAMVKTIPKGTSVGYGRTFVARQLRRVAVIPIGYWDGYDRGLSNRGVVLVHGQRCPVIGRVSMNMTMIDITRVRGVQVNDPVVLIGRQGRGVVTAHELAEASGTIHYEVLTRINPLIPRQLTK